MRVKRQRPRPARLRGGASVGRTAARESGRRPAEGPHGPAPAAGSESSRRQLAFPGRPQLSF